MAVKTKTAERTAKKRTAVQTADQATWGTARAVSKEVRESFRAWFRHNFVSQDEGRIGLRTYARAGELDDVCAGPSRGMWYRFAYERGTIDRTQAPTAEELGFLLRNPLVALQLALGVTDLRGLRCYRRGLTHEVNRLQARAYRARYYARDNARRRALAAERRRITRRTTLNPCPTPDALRAAFAARGASPEAKVRLGGLLEDLECHVDNCLRFGPDGGILGRNGGVKAWLREHVPELSGRYKTLMRYKALAKRLRQATGIADPVPASAVFDGPPAPPPGRKDVPGAGRRDALGADCEGTSGAGRKDVPGAGRGDVPPGRAERGRGDARDARDYYAVESHLAAARRLVEGCGNTCAALFRAVDAALEGTPRSKGRLRSKGKSRAQGKPRRPGRTCALGMKAGGRHPMAGAGHVKPGRAGARPSPRRANLEKQSPRAPC